MSKMLPSNRPALKRDRVDDILNFNLLPVKDCVILLGVRGYFEDSMGVKDKNDVGIYDDALFVISPNVFASFNFNTDPAKMGWHLAMLLPGKYKFYKGKHHPNSPHGYNALRPYPEGVQLPCIRDGVKSVCANTNLHKGGYKDTYSAGCQTVYPAQWNEAIELIYDQMTKWKQNQITYLLLEQKAIDEIP